MNFKKGFTLSEVLITLGIIGVVAALTIPNVVKQYKKIQTVTKLKKAYSILNQAYIKSKYDYGESFNSAYMASLNSQDAKKELFDKYWKPYIKNARYCYNYSDCGFSSNTPFKSITGNVLINTQVNTEINFITTDGIVYHLRRYGIYVSLYGGKGKNISGKDLFSFVANDNSIQPSSYTKDISLIKGNCKTNGQDCTAWIMHSGWKIDEDYPW